jgi:hypothetical protein
MFDLKYEKVYLKKLIQITTFATKHYRFSSIMYFNFVFDFDFNQLIKAEIVKQNEQCCLVEQTQQPEKSSLSEQVGTKDKIN